MKRFLIIVMIVVGCLLSSGIGFCENPYAEQIKVEESQFTGVLQGSGSDAQEVFEYIDRSDVLNGVNECKSLLTLISIILVIIAFLLFLILLKLWTP